jgi:hypothetical protein
MSGAFPIALYPFDRGGAAPWPQLEGDCGWPIRGSGLSVLP